MRPDVKKLLGSAANAVTGLLPRKDIIIFESNPDYSDNTYWFFKYLAEHTDVDQKYELVWIIKDIRNRKTELFGKKINYILKDADTPLEMARYIYYLTRAKFIIDCNSYVYKRHRDQVRVFLGHGMPFKIVKTYDYKKGEVDVNTITTYLFNDHFYSIHDTDDNMVNFGYCRGDVLAAHRGKRETDGSRCIVWMPTYRQHAKDGDLRIDSRFPLGFPVFKTREDLARVNECLRRNNVILYLRPHPVQDTSVLHLADMSNIVLADNAYLDSRGLTLYDFLTETDALITDYSSVYYDYLLLDRPIALAVEDLDEFKAKWPMYFDDFKANYICAYLNTTDELEAFIRDVADGNDPYAEARNAQMHRFHDYTDGRTCERLYKYLVRRFAL